ncbi:MAG: HNH endonuclease [Magnetococcales bacterium]|nr:HNH endonuclease [Magnetococcales bacterium]
MRPIQRGPSPRPHDYENYQDAKPDLVSRLGPYCSFCERPVVTLLAVEHVQPKDLPAYATLIGRWNNFLLACVNCNSIKGIKNVVPSAILLPDRDNTFAAFAYLPNGTIAPSDLAIDSGLQTIANRTLALTGLDKAALSTPDENGRQVALDRVSQRMEAWLTAAEANNDIQYSPDNAKLQDYVVKLAVEKGFFSIWMTVFAGDPNMLGRFVKAFHGTSGSGCFNANGGNVTPAPNPDGLPNGGKI